MKITKNFKFGFSKIAKEKKENTSPLQGAAMARSSKWALPAAAIGGIGTAAYNMMGKKKESV